MPKEVVFNVFPELWLIAMRANAVIDVAAIVITGVGFDMLVDVEIVVVTSVVIALKLVVDILAGVCAGATTGGEADFDTESNPSALEAVMTAVRIGIPPSLESLVFSW